MAEHRRRSIRLRGYDYSLPGIYFITICVQDRSCVLGHVEDEECRLSPAGEMIERKWQAIAGRFDMVQMGPYIVMPNHLHGLIQINALHPDDMSTNAASSSVGAMIQWFKTGTTYDYISGVKSLSWPHFNKRLWQRNYWEHIVRNEREYQRIADYIEANPSLWVNDSLHPDAIM